MKMGCAVRGPIIHDLEDEGGGAGAAKPILESGHDGIFDSGRHFALL